MPRISGTTNPTNLKEIARKDIRLTRADLGGKKVFEVGRLDLGGYDFRGDERVIVIARAGNTSRRYEIGTVAAWGRQPYSLDGLDPSQVLKFRILVREENSPRLLASAEGIRCAGDEDVESLLPIVSADLGERVWNLAIDEDGAVLQVNERVFPSGASAESYPPFRALVLPEALRQILDHLAEEPERLQSDAWMAWTAWMRSLDIDPPPRDGDLAEVWVRESTARFCDHFRSTSDLQQSLQHGAEA